MDKNNILIHIGYHKTATTWFQNEVFTSRNAQFEPLSIRKNGPNTLAPFFFMNQEGYSLSSFDNNLSEINNHLNEINNSKKNYSNKMWVMSHERLSGNIHVGGFDSSLILKRLKNVFPDAYVLIVIREQKSIFLSAYFQYLHNGGKDTLLDYFSRNYDGKRPGFSPEHFNYVPLIKEYKKEFGEKKVIVLPYEMFVQDYELFFKLFSEKINKEILPPVKSLDKKINVKQHKILLFLTRRFNLRGKSSSLNSFHKRNKIINFILKKVFNILTLFPLKKYKKNLMKKLEADVEKFIGDRYKENNKELGSLIGIDLKKYGY